MCCLRALQNALPVAKEFYCLSCLVRDLGPLLEHSAVVLRQRHGRSECLTVQVRARGPSPRTPPAEGGEDKWASGAVTGCHRELDGGIEDLPGVSKAREERTPMGGQDRLALDLTQQHCGQSAAALTPSQWASGGQARIIPCYAACSTKTTLRLEVGAPWSSLPLLRGAKGDAPLQVMASTGGKFVRRGSRGAGSRGMARGAKGAAAGPVDLAVGGPPCKDLLYPLDNVLSYTLGQGKREMGASYRGGGGRGHGTCTPVPSGSAVGLHGEIRDAPRACAIVRGERAPHEVRIAASDPAVGSPAGGSHRCGCIHLP